MTASMRERLQKAHREVVMLRANASEVRMDNGNFAWYGACARCTQPRYLQVSHIFPVGKYPRARYLPENAVAMCGPCHIYWWHKSPIDAVLWIVERMGEGEFTALKHKAMSGTKLDSFALLAELESEVERRRGVRA